MKKIFSLFFFILTLCLFGCDTWQGTDAEGYKAFQRMGGATSSLGDYRLISEDGDRFFLYDREELLCWKWECSHMDGECPAYYRYGTALLDVDSEGRLILLEGQSNDAARQNQVILWRIDSDLHQKETLGTFTLDEEGDLAPRWKSWCVEGNTLYVEANLGSRGNALLVGNLKSGESNTFLPAAEGQGQIEFMGVEEGSVYWKKDGNSLWYWDQEIENLFCGGEAVHDVLLTDHWIVYNETREGQAALYALDPDTKEERYLCGVTESARLYSAPGSDRFYILGEPATGALLYDIEQQAIV